MPGEPGAVDEDGTRCGDVVVVVDEEGQVGHCFVPAVCRDAQLGRATVGRAVDVVNAEVVFVVQFAEPGGVAIGGDSRDD